MEVTLVGLNDSKKALRIDGLPDSPVYMRARIVHRKEFRSDDGGYIQIKILPYEVDAEGEEILVGIPQPFKAELSKLQDRSMVLKDEIAAAVESMVPDFISYRTSTKYMQTLPDELVL